MDLQISPQERAFREEVRTFVQTRLPQDIRERVLNFRRVGREDYVRWQNILHSHGWGAPSWPVEYGGTAWNALQRNIFDEETFSGGAPRQMPFGLTLVGPVIQKYGRSDQKAYFLPKILTLEHWWCQGYSEPGAGSDLASLTTRARKEGNRYVVTGQKTWTSFAHWANWIFCLVRTASGGRPQAGISFLLIDLNTPGVKVSPIRTLDGGSDVNDVFFEDVEVPVENLIGEENQGWSIAKFLLGNERMNVAALGNCKRLAHRVKEIARSESKRGRPLIEDVRFRDKLARVEMDLIAHEWSVLRTIAMEMGGEPIGPLASILKIRSSEIQQDLSELAMECAGPYALPYVMEALEGTSRVDTASSAVLNALAAQYFDWRKISIYGGSTEIQKNIIGKMIFGT
jgi:alkylation response protein AidB-like acyl-CoA dehydrogenase